MPGVLLTSANGARALAEASEQRSKPIFAVGDTTAATAEGLGFNSVTSASGDARPWPIWCAQRLDPKAGPLLHVARRRCRGLGLRPTASRCSGFALYEAREAEALPDLGARRPGGPRARCRHLLLAARARTPSSQLVTAAGLADTCRAVTAIAISPAAAAAARRAALCQDRRGRAAHPAGRAG